MSLEHTEEPIGPSEPIIEEVDLSAGWDKESIRDIIIERIKELGIYGPNLLFRGFPGEKIEIIKQHGTDIPADSVIFCSRESELVDETASKQSALDFALRHKEAGLAVYNRQKLMADSTKYASGYEYIAKKGYTFKDALIAVLLLK